MHILINIVQILISFLKYILQRYGHLVWILAVVRQDVRSVLLVTQNLCDKSTSRSQLSRILYSHCRLNENDMVIVITWTYGWFYVKWLALFLISLGANGWPWFLLQSVCTVINYELNTLAFTPPIWLIVRHKELTGSNCGVFLRKANPHSE